ncbi:MAG TPA: flagellar basal body-associated FliL family protein [Gaiellaceae bacterium]|jgi:flagellar basal body-associated protein FliL|nr:flagellar basal body-associated FliL family protein [Gaiellaceae bacterium]
MKSKLKFIIPVPILLVVLFGAYTMLLSPKPAAAKEKIVGTLVPLANPFIVNLAGERYGKLSVSLLLTKAPPPSTTGLPVTLPEDSAVRAIITDETTGIPASELIDRKTRNELLTRILKRMQHTTDEPVTQVLITDLAVQ